MILNAFRKLFSNSQNRKSRRSSCLPRLELLGLEQRIVPSTITVTTTSDSGAGSLRAAITLANTTAGNDIIDFNITSGTSPITLISALPSIVSASSNIIGGGTAGTVTINNGLVASSLTIDANKGNFSIFTISPGGDLNISGVTVTGANSLIAGGAFRISGTVTISNSTISGNTAVVGGGIWNAGITTVSNSTISGNTAVTEGGGIWNDGGGTLTVTNSTLSGNIATSPSGKFGYGNGGAIRNNSGGTITISGSTLSNNKANYGGAIDNTRGTITITNSTISGNTSSTSGGILNYYGTLTVTNSTISGNTSYNGGAIWNNSNLTITNSTLSGNTSKTFGKGGGIYNRYDGILNIANTTLASNTANLGGGIFNGGALTLTNSTLSGNSVTTNGGGIYNTNQGTHVGILNIANTIIANSTKADYAGNGTIGINSSNLVEDGSIANNSSTSLGSGDISGDPGLGILQNNGGPTFTMALSTTSPAIGAGNASISSAKDQRGYTRLSTPSIGAFEFFPATQATLSNQAMVSTQAAGSASGSAFTTQPQITLKDIFGNTVNTNAPVTMTVSGNGTTIGSTTINAVNSVATFSGVGISGTVGTVYTLTFASAGLTSATQFIRTLNGSATQATLSTQAAGSATGSPFTTQPIVTIKDAFGNTVTNSTVSVTMAVSSGATTLGTTTINAVAGIATFSGVGIFGTAGTSYTLTFTPAGLTPATQSITPFGVATQVELTTPAVGSTNGLAFTTQPVITIKDANGTTVTNSTASVTMTVSSGATTIGVTTKNAVNGVATFSGVGISGTAGTIYSLTFTSGSFTTTQSITPLGAANKPTFGAPTATADGFTVQIANYDGAFTYAGTATASGTVAISSTGLVTVTGVVANTSSTATITTTRANFVSGSAPVTETSNVASLVTGTPAVSSGGSSTVTFYDPENDEEVGSVVPFPGFTGEIRVVSGDFNGDGFADIIAGAGKGGGPAIVVIDSQTGKVIKSFFAFDPSFTGGVFVAVQDTNGDGTLDIIAGAGPGGGPEVRIFDGASLNNVLRSFYAYDQSFAGGVSVASIDFNHDGILDIVTGAGPGAAPHVKVYDGSTKAILSQWYAYPVSFTGGVYVAAGDLDNDGNIEVVTGAGAGGAPVVAVWDPHTGALLAQFMAYAEDFTGGVRVAINDADGDNDGDLNIITGAGLGGAPEVKVFSFPTLDLLFSYYSGAANNKGGVNVS
ncbi:MAG: hypothetical protein NTV50_00615 [Planctomycetota bacterium]|nr:hypothetical protein [Planctomycetota bacterium]